MLMVLMGVEKQVASKKLNNNAADRPHIADFVPFAALKQDLGRTVLTGVYNGTVMFIVLGG